MSDISETASKLIAGARQASSTKNYESAWRKWIDCCSRRQIDPFYCDINPVLDFLGELFRAGYEFSTTGCHRIALSAYYRPINDSKVGVHPRVSELIKGVINNKPPKPKHPMGCSTSLDFIKESWSDNKKISGKETSLKLVM